MVNRSCVGRVRRLLFYRDRFSLFPPPDTPEMESWHLAAKEQISYCIVEIPHRNILETSLTTMVSSFPEGTGKGIVLFDYHKYFNLHYANMFQY